MYTQCPECLTIYEIDEDALQASLGIVRCGRCDQRFDALRTLSDTLPIEPLAALPEQEPAERAPTLTEAVAPSTIERAGKKSRSDTSPPASAPAEQVEPSLPGPAPAAEPQAGDGADWFSEVASELTASPDVDLDLPPDTEVDTWAVEFPEETIFEDAASDIRSDASTDELAGNTTTEETADSWEAAMPAPADADVPRELAPEAPGLQTPDPLVSGADDADVAPDDPIVAAADIEAEEIPAELPPESALAEPEPEVVAPAPVYVPPRRRFPRTGALWALGCILLALLLAALLAWANRVELFRNPATQPWMTRICSQVPCNLPLIKDTSKLELLSRDVRPDPNTSGALTITATVRNNAGFSQPWPIVVVELTDLDNNPVAMRRFRPAEYMPDPARRAAGFAPGTTAAVAFEVVDPGRRAVAFQFGFE